MAVEAVSVKGTKWLQMENEQVITESTSSLSVTGEMGAFSRLKLMQIFWRLCFKFWNIMLEIYKVSVLVLLPINSFQFLYQHGRRRVDRIFKMIPYFNSNKMPYKLFLIYIYISGGHRLIF